MYQNNLQNLINYIFRLLKQNQKGDEIEFYLRICGDIFLEILKFGDRRHLTKLERVGRLFHGLIDGYYYFAEKPFLRLDIQLKPRFSFLFEHGQIFVTVDF